MAWDGRTGPTDRDPWWYNPYWYAPSYSYYPYDTGYNNAPYDPYDANDYDSRASYSIAPRLDAAALHFDVNVGVGD